MSNNQPSPADAAATTNPIPITVFTGFLGAGKTTIILSLLKRLPKDYNVVVLKNEFGDVKGECFFLCATREKKRGAVREEEGEVGWLITSEAVPETGKFSSNDLTVPTPSPPPLPSSTPVSLSKSKSYSTVDSELVRESNVQVTEMLNGCLCCVLVGQMKNALMEIRDKYKPHRIIVETSGSAFPAPIAWQVREMASDGFTLDAIITVIDCVNFSGYEDTSYTAKMQAKYTDLILLNKHEEVTERQLDTVLDHVYELNEDTPKIKCEGSTGVSPDLIFGIDTKLFQLSDRELHSQPQSQSANGHPESQGKDGEGQLERQGSAEEMLDQRHHFREVDIIQVVVLGGAEKGEAHPTHTEESLGRFLDSVSKENVYRIKGFVRLQRSPSSSTNEVLPTHGTNGVSATTSEHDTQLNILNWAFGRYTLTPVTKSSPGNDDVWVKITVMGVELEGLVGKFRDGFGARTEGEITFSPAEEEDGHGH
ncbi:hypothetical protein HK102_011851 [Quaeritorhiza haematococci]|nr:hypothetical protein HK102_011851 [Quaeritorhiza haematococci]